MLHLHRWSIRCSRRWSLPSRPRTRASRSARGWFSPKNEEKMQDDGEEDDVWYREPQPQQTYIQLMNSSCASATPEGEGAYALTEVMRILYNMVSRVSEKPSVELRAGDRSNTYYEHAHAHVGLEWLRTREVIEVDRFSKEVSATVWISGYTIRTRTVGCVISEKSLVRTLLGVQSKSSYLSNRKQRAYENAWALHHQVLEVFYNKTCNKSLEVILPHAEKDSS